MGGNLFNLNGDIVHYVEQKNIVKGKVKYLETILPVFCCFLGELYIEDQSLWCYCKL